MAGERRDGLGAADHRRHTRRSPACAEDGYQAAGFDPGQRPLPVSKGVQRGGLAAPFRPGEPYISPWRAVRFIGLGMLLPSQFVSLTNAPIGR
ncbi:MAG: hypothetical protein ACRDRY_16630 [Pseudonocardiaceae bacterium]